MKVKELIEKLQKLNPDAEVLTGAINDERIHTYGLLDLVHEFPFEQIKTDLMHTCGDIDYRIAENKKSKDIIIYLGTSFGH